METVPEVKPAEKPLVKLTPVVDSGEFAQLLDSDRFAQVQRVARLFASSQLVPEIFQGNEANCVVALQMAFRMHIDPMMLMQSMYIVHSKPGIEGKLAIALINSRGPFTGPLQWRFTGAPKTDEWACYCYATHRITREKCEAKVDWAMVKAEGWLGKDGSKWKTMPEQMFQYRTAMFLGRLYCPEVLLGLPTIDELRDIGVRTVEGERVIDARSAPVETRSAVDEINAGLKSGDALPNWEDVQAAPRPRQPDNVLARPSEAIDAQPQRAAEIQSEFTPPSWAEIAHQINKSETGADFELCDDLIRSIKDDAKRGELEKLKTDRLAELAAAAAALKRRR